MQLNHTSIFLINYFCILRNMHLNICYRILNPMLFKKVETNVYQVDCIILTNWMWGIIYFQGNF